MPRTSRPASDRSRVWGAALSLVALVSCGTAAEHPAVADGSTGDDGLGMTTGSGGSQTGGSGGAPPVAGHGGASSGDSGGATGQGGAAGGATGQGGAGGGTAGAAGVAPPTVDVSGRWGLFVFEDPAGVLLSQAADGTITGRGCSVGAPGVVPAQPENPDTFYGCAPLSGRVSGQEASFAFGTSFEYRAVVVVSADGQRMTGTLTTSSGPILYPLAWRRVAEDALWLDRGDFMRADPLADRYELTLIPEESVGTEFVAGTTYPIVYREHTIFGTLGCFWTDEISAVAAGSPLRVGPVPGTDPALPHSLSIDFDGAGFTGVTANTPSGGRYRFAVAKGMP